jgi:ankyrin repeat protein
MISWLTRIVSSKPQYESQFMRWGFKKKLTREIWHTIGHIIKSRDEDGLVSHVYAYGTKLAPEKIKKETARYKTCHENGECCAQKELPMGVDVRADDEEVEETILSQEAQGIHLNSSPTRWPSNEQHTLEAFWDTTSALGFFEPNNSQLLHNRLVTDLPTPITFDDTVQHVPFSDISSLVSYPEPTLTNQWSCGTRHSLWAASFIPMNTISLFTNLNTPLFREFRALINNNQSEIFASIDQTKYLLPSESTQLQRSSVDMVILKQILYLLMNNFAGSDYAAMDTIFEQVKQFPVAHMEDMLDALPGPFAAALQQSILTIAIKSGIPGLVEILVRRGIDSNRVTCRFGGSRFMPLGLACKFRRLEVVKVLLRAGADPNLKVDNHDSSHHISCLFDGPNSNDIKSTFPQSVYDILQQLLEYHAEMGLYDLNYHWFWKSETFVDVFTHHHKYPVDIDDETTSDLVTEVVDYILRFCEPQRIVAVFQSILGKDFVLQHHQTSVMDCLHSALEYASYTGNLSLVSFLLGLGLTPSSPCLIKAISGNKIPLVKMYIQMGVVLNGIIPCTHQYLALTKNFPSGVDPYLLKSSIQQSYTTPFAEAIRWDRREIIDLLRDMDVFQTCKDPERFVAAIRAAAEAGNRGMVQELLALSKSNSEIHLLPQTNLITAAILGGNEEIVELLMMAGASLDYTNVASAIMTRNARLVQLLLDTGVDISERPGIALLAVRWGNQDILKMVIAAVVDINEPRFDLPPLSLPLHIKQRISSPLVEAMWLGNSNIVRILLENGADVNRNFSIDVISPLEAAINCGQDAVVYEILAHGADPNDPFALQAAANKSHKLTEAIVASFCQRYPNGNRSFVIPALRQRIKQKDEKMVKMLASHAALNDSTCLFLGDRTGSSQLFPSLLGEGIATDNFEIVQILLEHGGDPNSTVEVAPPHPCRGRLNAVLKAISIGNLAMVKLLHKKGADLNFSAKIGITRSSLQLAAELGHFEIAQYLLNQGVDVNAPPCIWEGGTALQFAAKTGSVCIAEMLSEHGADINAPGSRYLGKTAFEFAAEHGRMDMLLFLFHRGVDIVSDGGEQVRRACEFAEENGQIAAKGLVEQLSVEANQRVFPTLYQTPW